MLRHLDTPSRLLSLTLAVVALPLSAQTETDNNADYVILPTLVIDSQETANEHPVATYDTLVSNLEFDPRIDLQSRNMAEAQGDVTVRGGIFENTGFRIGSATLIDPQTGHYFAELPIAPEMLSGPRVYTGVDNALYGFNSTVGTISYSWTEINDGGSLTLGVGDNDLNFQRIHHGLTGRLGASDSWSWGVELESSRSESDGTIAFGDHDFDRTTGRVQVLGPNSQTDLFAGYQSKFFGWPGMYTANPARLETENIKTRLFLLNHSQFYGDGSELELTAYYRSNSDHYVFTRNNPGLYQAFHETKASSLAIAGRHFFSQAWAVNYSGQFTADQIESTTLENSFTSRRYYKLTLLPEYKFQLSELESITVRAGATIDETTRDESELSGLFDVTWLRTHSNGDSESAYISLSEASQVAGYTAIGGPTVGLFGSNPTLGRETSQNLEFGFKINRDSWSLDAATFYRWDDDLVDWTFSAGTPNARTADSVDIETFGFEVITTRRWHQVEAIASYTYLHKDESYEDPTITGSFYALNYPEHRVTLGAIWNPSSLFEFRLDNEWRQQRDNALRTSDDEAVFTHFGASYYPEQVEGLEIFIAIDKPWDEAFQDVPGTPGRGDQYSAGLTYRW